MADFSKQASYCSVDSDRQLNWSNSRQDRRSNWLIGCKRDEVGHFAGLGVRMDGPLRRRQQPARGRDQEEYSYITSSDWLLIITHLDRVSYWHQTGWSAGPGFVVGRHLPVGVEHLAPSRVHVVCTYSDNLANTHALVATLVSFGNGLLRIWCPSASLFTYGTWFRRTGAPSPLANLLRRQCFRQRWFLRGPRSTSRQMIMVAHLDRVRTFSPIEYIVIAQWSCWRERRAKKVRSSKLKHEKSGLKSKGSAHWSRLSGGKVLV
jgi:hypothetical protein